MTFPSKESLRQVWLAALEQELGLAIKVDQKPMIRNDLLTTRREMNDPRLAELMLCMPPGDEIFIVKKSVELP